MKINDIYLRKSVDVNQEEDRWAGSVEVYLRLIRVLYVFYVTENMSIHTSSCKQQCSIVTALYYITNIRNNTTCKIKTFTK